MSHLFLIEYNGTSHEIVGDFAPRNSASASLTDADANVLFGLNLPPNPALNHKLIQGITLAYG
ncbi:hypothetical protein ACYBNI_06725 [Klebsiella pneumoniae]|uniref:hypothetical protein n=1 Tax=Klebsiella pneumoniae TaxID=573 RepID=UPI0029641C30|nr:hypothetical protein [Klebsiella pneumoniae]MDW1320643.1 hypothetical protein [Klebsiella pneumoniae]